ncbi:hypothetical protein [Pseudomonas sp.]|uniref:hypothetical protein n=1 Tax=Pseudomonas sp. TaxID=306 RepID=UPI00291311BB|nr:hypothetical protein [Pseudomonas sp.]MDU4254568.1 hypothetical protein [Pseudomonas sp.]
MVGEHLQQVASCPRCNLLSGWYEKRVCKYRQIFDPDGTPFDTSNMERISGGARRYCIECDRDITELVQMVAEPAADLAG